MQVVVFEAEDWERKACERLAPTHEVRCLSQPLNGDTAGDFSGTEAISTFVESRLNAATLTPFSALRLIATRSTGVDHIDLDDCRGAGVMVCNVPDYGDPTVAEHTFALLLALMRRIPQAVERTRRGDFSQAGLRGFDLAGRTLGVVGVGRIGRRVIRIARGFGMEILAHDAKLDPDASDEAVTFGELGELLRRCDVLTLHVPGGAATHHLIGAAELALMKRGAVLINTARGGVVDVEALIDALASGRLAGAALDVLGEEPWLRDEAQVFRAGVETDATRLRTLVADHALLAMPNVIVTPHIAYDTQEAVVRIMDITLGNIEAFAAGAPTHRVPC